MHAASRAFAAALAPEPALGRAPRLLGVHRLHYRKGGAEGVHLDHLALFRERGWDCAEFAMDHPDNEPSEWSDYFPDNFEAPRGLRALASLPRFFHSGEARRKFSALLDAFEPDVIHTHGIYHHFTPAILAPALERRIPILYTLHDYKLLCPAYYLYRENVGVCEGCKGGAQWKCLTNRCTGGSLAKDAVYAADGMRQWRTGAIRSAVAKFVGPSQFLVDKFVEHGFERDKLAYVPNFFESADDAPADPVDVAALRARHGAHVLFFGRLSSEKGVNVLIAAAAKAKFPLVLVGDGPKRDELEAQAAASGADVTFAGHLKGAALWAYVEAADCVAMPSVWYENAPKALLEAQARRKPVIASAMGGIPEMIEDGVTGRLVKPNDPDALAAALIQTLAETPERRAEMGARARQSATRRFTRESYYRSMFALYQEAQPSLRDMRADGTFSCTKSC